MIIPTYYIGENNLFFLCMGHFAITHHLVFLPSSTIATILGHMSEPMKFMLQPHRGGWKGGEPRVFAVDLEDRFPEHWDSVKEARLIDIRYAGGGITTLLEQIAVSADVADGSFQAILENLEEISHKTPLVIIVRDADRLLADVGPALIHIIIGWEDFTHHAGDISAMYLVLETGPRAVTNSAFHPGGVIEWLPASQRK